MDFYSSLDSSQLNTQKPTIFEVFSSDQLDSLLTPSLRFLLTHYTHRYPRVLLKVLNNFDELNVILRGTIEYIYLKTWNATFIEKFYGIKRVSSIPFIPKSQSIVLNNSNKYDQLTRLSSFQVFCSLIDTVGIPYIATKLQRYHEKLVPEYLLNSIQINNVEQTDPEVEIINEKYKDNALILKLLNILYKLKKLLKDVFFKSYPSIKLSLKLITLLLNILYLSNKTSSFTIVQLLSKVAYARITRSDHLRVESQLSSSPTLSNNDLTVPPTLSSVIFSNAQAMVQPIRKFAWATTDTILPVSIFLLKFLEWYNSNRNAQNNNNKNDVNEFTTPIVPSIVPIDALQSENVNKLVSTDESGCRLCHKPLHNPAIIETGYVFCYKCIYEYLRDQPKETGGRCPVTGRKLLACSWVDTKNEWTVKGLRRIII